MKNIALAIVAVGFLWTASESEDDFAGKLASTIGFAAAIAVFIV